MGANCNQHLGNKQTEDVLIPIKFPLESVQMAYCGSETTYLYQTILCGTTVQLCTTSDGKFCVPNDGLCPKEQYIFLHLTASFSPCSYYLLKVGSDGTLYFDSGQLEMKITEPWIVTTDWNSVQAAELWDAQKVAFFERASITFYTWA